MTGLIVTFVLTAAHQDMSWSTSTGVWVPSTTATSEAPTWA